MHLFGTLRSAPVLDIRFWQSCPEQILRERREARSGYLTNEGTVFVDPPGYWTGLVWPAYLETNTFLNNPAERDKLALIEHDSSVQTLDETLASVIQHLGKFVQSYD